ncbi:hypothetical protein [Allokutzneria oryzae]|uniref:Uncharacterized protein n=1 Tax=Allokutzneria oryzae TaxID=1378989 RepID=A0ABV6A695_9PSEU
MIAVGAMVGTAADANAESQCWPSEGCVNVAGPYTGPQGLKECQKDLPYYTDRYVDLFCGQITLEPAYELFGRPR